MSMIKNPKKTMPKVYNFDLFLLSLNFLLHLTIFRSFFSCSYSQISSTFARQVSTSLSSTWSSAHSKLLQHCIFCRGVRNCETKKTKNRGYRCATYIPVWAFLEFSPGQQPPPSLHVHLQRSSPRITEDKHKVLLMPDL